MRTHRDRPAENLHEVLERRLVIRVDKDQVLREQQPDHVVVVFAEHRDAAEAALKNHRQCLESNTAAFWRHIIRCVARRREKTRARSTQKSNMLVAEKLARRGKRYIEKERHREAVLELLHGCVLEQGLCRLGERRMQSGGMAVAAIDVFCSWALREFLPEYGRIPHEREKVYSGTTIWYGRPLRSDGALVEGRAVRNRGQVLQLRRNGTKISRNRTGHQSRECEFSPQLATIGYELFAAISRLLV